MRRTMLLKITGLAHSKEEKKTKQMDKEEGMKEKRKEEVKLHCLKTPLLEQSHC
jgi:hypothetical protein